MIRRPIMAYNKLLKTFPIIGKIKLQLFTYTLHVRHKDSVFHPLCFEPDSMSSVQRIRIRIKIYFIDPYE